MAWRSPTEPRDWRPWAHDRIHVNGEALPLGQSICQCLQTLGGDQVIAPTHVVRGIFPAAFDQLGLLQTVERRIKSAFFEGEVAIASLVHFFHDLVAVHSFLLKKGKKQSVGIAFQHFLLVHRDTGPV